MISALLLILWFAALPQTAAAFQTATAMPQVTETNQATKATKATEATKASGHNWLAQLPGKTPFENLHLPGTHNSSARFEPWPGTAKCQSLTIKEQLQAGVRFLDIRCRHQANHFHLYHGMIDQRQTFEQLHQTIVDFLTANPSECIIVSIQETAKPAENTRSFEATFSDYQAQQPDLWHLDSKIPTLATVRGKAILLRRFRSKNPIGINATNWRSDRVHANKTLLLQDRFKVQKPTTKWKHIEQLWQESPKHTDKLKLNFTSGYQSGGFGIPNITAVSKAINSRLQTRLKSAPSPPPSTLVLDFITPDLAQAIYGLN